jgi:hypothetical protein
MISPLQSSSHFDTCRSICPIQTIRARADFERDLEKLDIDSDFTEEVELCVLRVQSVAEMRLEDSEIPVRFFWDSCGTNYIYAGKDKTRFLADSVYDWNGAIESNTGVPWLRFDDNPNPCKALSPKDADFRRVTFKNGIITFVGLGPGGMNIPCDRGDLDGDGVYVSDKDQRIIEDILLGKGIDWRNLDTNCVNKAKDVDQDGIPFTLRDLAFGSIYGLPDPEIIPVREPTDTVFIYVSWQSSKLNIVKEIENAYEVSAAMLLVFKADSDIDSLQVSSDFGKVTARSHFPAYHHELRILLRTDAPVHPPRKLKNGQQTIDLRIFSEAELTFLNARAFDYLCSQLIPVVINK